MANEWTRRELEAAVEAYLQMQRLVAAGQKVNKSEVRRRLLAGPIAGRTTTEQRMQNISSVLHGMGRPWLSGYAPLPNVGPNSARVIREIILEMTSEDAPPIPPVPPATPGPARALPSTGYWMFVCSRRHWDGEAWLQSGRDRLLYKVALHNRFEVHAGDLGVIRIDAKGAGSRRTPAGVYAVVEVEGPAEFQSDPDASAYSDPSAALKDEWRAPLRVLANLVDRPISAETLPDTEDFKYVRHAIQASSIPLSRTAFSELFRRAGLSGRDVSEQQLADSLKGIAALEASAAKDPKRRERISSYIERGKIGEQVKALRGGRCQVCEALGQQPIAFRKADGSPYAEAHHVHPVHKMIAGSLGAQNIMVLCPNHHREFHYGDCEVLKHGADSWTVRLGSAVCEITRPSIA